MNLTVLKNLPRKTWLIVIGATTLVLSAVIIYLMAGSLQRLGEDPDVPGFMRRAGDEQSLFAQIATKDSEIAAQNAIAAKHSERQRLLDSMKNDIEVARKRLPTESQKAETRQLIEDLARQVGSTAGALVVKSVSIREAAPSSGRAAAGDYQSIEYQTAVTSDMDGLIQFINLIERNERFMTVEGIQLTTGGVVFNRDTSKVENKQHTANLRIVTYTDSSGAKAGARRN